MRSMQNVIKMQEDKILRQFRILRNQLQMEKQIPKWIHK